MVELKLVSFIKQTGVAKASIPRLTANAGVASAKSRLCRCQWRVLTTDEAWKRGRSTADTACFVLNLLLQRKMYEHDWHWQQFHEMLSRYSHCAIRRFMQSLLRWTFAQQELLEVAFQCNCWKSSYSCQFILWIGLGAHSLHFGCRTRIFKANHI